MAFEDPDLNSWLERIRTLYARSDPAHDFSHILRVCKNAGIIGKEEGADMRVLLLAALLHDLGSSKGRDQIRRIPPMTAKPDSLLPQHPLP